MGFLRLLNFQKFSKRCSVLHFCPMFHLFPAGAPVFPAFQDEIVGEDEDHGTVFRLDATRFAEAEEVLGGDIGQVGQAAGGDFAAKGIVQAEGQLIAPDLEKPATGDVEHGGRGAQKTERRQLLVNEPLVEIGAKTGDERLVVADLGLQPDGDVEHGTVAEHNDGALWFYFRGKAVEGVVHIVNGHVAGNLFKILGGDGYPGLLYPEICTKTQGPRRFIIQQIR